MIDAMFSLWMINCFVLQEPNLSLLCCAISFLPGCCCLWHSGTQIRKKKRWRLDRPGCSARPGCLHYTEQPAQLAGVCCTQHTSSALQHCWHLTVVQCHQRSRQMNHHRFIQYPKLEEICRDHWARLCCISVLAKMHTF